MLLTNSKFIGAILLVVTALQFITADNTDCDVLAKNYTAALDTLSSNYSMVLGLTCPSTKQSLLHAFLCEPDNSTDAAPLFSDFCSMVRSTGQLGTEFSRQCSSNSIERSVTYTPDVLLALASLCQTGDLAKYIRAVTPCIRKREDEIGLPWILSPAQEWGRDMMSVTESCMCFPNMFRVNRPFLCRFLQGVLAYTNGDKGRTVVEACGQEALDGFLELREKALLALNCAEFGDYVRTYKYMNVKYQDGKMID
ncbi:uncharacterized protein LOC129586530 [Paramacrobiotus metropolitanus]|uniref:uncharacterized protein LOC129586530 n=1 Tax=Paramacrobiotus metropolitanus TaxID=2943436 RepID=UPI0024461A9B|nr:uncharacterized protein LOC129586530 [Paramacrobiotus metropolitanus]